MTEREPQPRVGEAEMVEKLKCVAKHGWGLRLDTRSQVALAQKLIEEHGLKPVEIKVNECATA